MKCYKVGDKDVIGGIVENIRREGLEESRVRYSIQIYGVLNGTTIDEVYFDPKVVDVKIGELYYFHIELAKATKLVPYPHHRLTDAKQYESDKVHNPDSIEGSEWGG